MRLLVRFFIIMDFQHVLTHTYIITMPYTGQPVLYTESVSSGDAVISILMAFIMLFLVYSHIMDVQR